MQVRLQGHSLCVKVIGSRSRSQEQKSMFVCLSLCNLKQVNDSVVYITIQWGGGGKFGLADLSSLDLGWQI